MLVTMQLIPERNNTWITISAIFEESWHQRTLHEELKFCEYPIFSRVQLVNGLSITALFPYGTNFRIYEM